MTDEEKSPHDVAKEKIEDILRELIAAESEGEEFLVDWMLMASAHVEVPGENRGVTGYRVMIRDGQPPHNTLGLLEHEVMKFKNYMTGHGPECTC